MKWQVDKPPYDYCDWHLWFAWKPVQIKSYKHWLCFVNRRAKFTYRIKLSEQEAVIKSGEEFVWEYEELEYYY